jgi:hypothetical protein
MHDWGFPDRIFPGAPATDRPRTPLIRYYRPAGGTSLSREGLPAQAAVLTLCLFMAMPARAKDQKFKNTSANQCDCGLCGRGLRRLFSPAVFIKKII